jgi:hypothetical protein
MTSGADVYEALWRKAHNAYCGFGTPEFLTRTGCEMGQAAASVLRDHVEAKLAEVRVELDALKQAADMQTETIDRVLRERDDARDTIAEQAAELERKDRALLEIRAADTKMTPPMIYCFYTDEYVKQDVVPIYGKFAMVADAALKGSPDE